MPKSFGQTLLELAEDDPRICGVSCDCWGFVAPLAERFPERAIELGIAEQNLIGVSAGLALTGKIPFAVGMNPFVTMRCFEQVRTDLGYGCRNVKVIGGYGSGLEFAGWGCTHHAMEEIALMRLIPGMTVFMPADSYDTEMAIRAAAKIDGPCYVALAGGDLPLDASSRSFELGKAVAFRDGDAATLLSTGILTAEALKAADMLASEGVSVRMLHFPTIKPLDRAAVLLAARETPLLVTMEEHTVIGGLGGAVAEVLAEEPTGARLIRLGLQDEFAVMSGYRDDFRERYRMNAASAVERIKESLSRRI